MADARTLLRAARAERRIQHPAAQYTSSGKLICKLCEINVKDDKKAWSSHLSSTQHALRQSQADDAARLNKKRKVDQVDDEDVETEERKRARGASEDEQNGPEAGPDVAGEDGQVETEAQSQTGVEKDVNSKPTNATQEAEFAAFLNDFARDEEDQPAAPPAASNATATISAAPVSADEVAGQTRDEDGTQKRGRRDEEIEAEREDAAERLQEEFEEMEGFEARVKRLKERREMLRRESATGDSIANPPLPPVAAEQPQVPEAIDEGSSDEDEFDDWRFGAS